MPKLKIVLIGYMCDLEREISKEEGQQKTQKFQLPFFEISVKDKTGVDEWCEYIKNEVIKTNLDK